MNRVNRMKTFVEELNRYGITEQRFNTLRNRGISKELLECMYLYGLDLNSDDIYKVKNVIDANDKIEKRKKWKWLYSLCCCCWFCGTTRKR